MSKAKIRKCWLVMKETAKTWRKFDEALKAAGFSTRTAGFKALLYYVIETGKFPRR